MPLALKDFAGISPKESAGHILLIEDDKNLATNLVVMLEGEGFEVTVASSGDDGLNRIREVDADAVLTDLRMPGLGGLELVQQLHESRPRLPVVLMTAYGTIETAIEATKHGAYDYLQKPFEMRSLLAVLRRAVEAARLMLEPVVLAGSPVESRAALVGSSQVMLEVYKEIGRVAAKPVTVLIRGETGSGKELAARAVYQHSPRARAPFVAINCAASPENLLESELFGHERGAFTGADHRRIGRFEQANKGTLFLDEIGDLPHHTQVKLLRVLQQQTFQRVGGSETLAVDVRVIAATHRNLEAMLRDGRFREDLYHRLNVVCLQLPPLRARSEDIPSLVEHFISKYAGEFGVERPTITPAAMDILRADPWPGNVRELENVTRRLLLAARGLSVNAEAVRRTLAARNLGPELSVNSLVAEISELLDRARKGELNDAHSRILAKAERELFKQAMELSEGNQAQAARWLGLSRVTVREKLIQLGMHPGAGVTSGESGS